MGVIDIIIILVFVFGGYLGYQRGFIKGLSDFVVLFVTSFLAGKISDLLFGMLYKIFPFFNFSGKSEGLKAINIILWKLILYILIIIIMIFLIRKFYIKFKIKNKIMDSMIEANMITKIFGVVISIPLTLILLFNIMLVGLSPNFNLTSVNDSKLASTIMEKTPVLSKENINLYRNQKYIIERINEDDNTIENYKNINNDIVNNIINTSLVSEDKIEFLEKKNKLIGTRKELKENNKDAEEALDSSSNNSSDDTLNSTEDTKSYENEVDDNQEDDNQEDDNQKYYDLSTQEEDYIDESDVIIEEEIPGGEFDDSAEENEEIDYCEEFPGDC